MENDAAWCRVGLNVLQRQTYRLAFVRPRQCASGVHDIIASIPHEQPLATKPVGQHVAFFSRRPVERGAPDHIDSISNWKVLQTALQCHHLRPAGPHGVPAEDNEPTVLQRFPDHLDDLFLDPMRQARDPARREQHDPVVVVAFYRLHRAYVMYVGRGFAPVRFFKRDADLVHQPKHFASRSGIDDSADVPPSALARGQTRGTAKHSS